MTRLNNIFHNHASSAKGASTTCTAPTTSTAAAATPGNPGASASKDAQDTSLIDGAVSYALEGVENLEDEANGLIDKLKPKLQEIVQEISDEQQKLCVQTSSFDAVSSFKKLPVLPKLAHRLPEPVKLRAIKVLNAISRKKTSVDTASPKAPEASPSVAQTQACSSGNEPVTAQDGQNVWNQLCTQVHPSGILGRISATTASVQQRSSSALGSLKNNLGCSSEVKAKEVGESKSSETKPSASNEAASTQTETAAPAGSPGPAPVPAPALPAEPIVTH